MRKFFALLALVLGVVSCQTEPEGFDAVVGGEKEVNITVSLPEATRSDSAVGAFGNVDFTKYDVRFQCEVHYGDQKKALETQISDNGKTATFPVRLIPGRDYTFVVWADLVLEGSTADLHYTTTNTNRLADITLKGEWNAMDDTRDAYTCAETHKFLGDGNISLTLTRPFAKLRVKTTDMHELLGVDPAKAKVTYTTQHYTSYNAVEKTVGTKAAKTHDTFAIATYTENEGENKKTLFADYFFAKADQEVVNFTLEVMEENGTRIIERTFNTPIPVKRNTLTTIEGNILTYGDNITVTIEDEFAGSFDETLEGETTATVATTEDFIAAVENNDIENIVLGGNINLNELLTRAAADPSLTIAAGKELTIDLGGYTLSATSTQTGKNYNMFDVRGTLTVKNGIMEYEHKGENMYWNASTNLFNVTAGGVLNLEGVTAKNLGGSDMGFVAHLNNWGEVTLNVENSTLESNYVAVRVFNSGYDKNNVTIKNSTLKGGNYAFWVHNYTVADFGTEEKAESQKKLLNFDIFNGTNTFVGKNATPIRYGMTNSIYCDSENRASNIVDTVEELLAAIKVANNRIYVYPNSESNDGSYDTECKISLAEGVALIGVGETPVVIKNTWASDLFTKQCYFRNTHMENIYNSNNLTINMAYAVGNVSFKKCTFGGSSTAHQGVHFDGNDGKLTFDECTFVGRNMFAASLDTVTFNKCYFENKRSAQTGSDKWTGVNMWGTYEFNNCVFGSEATCNVKCDGVVATFNNCNYEDGKAMTEVISNSNNYDAEIYMSVATAEELVAALAANYNVIFANDITVAATKGGYNKAGILQNKAQTINGNGHTLTVTDAGTTWDCAIYTNGGVIKNLTVAGAMRGVFTAGQSSDLNIENVIFKNVIYTFNSDGKMPANPFGVYVSNSVVNGWTSHSDMHTEVVYTDCSFGEGSGYKYCRPYGKTAFVNCTFCAGYTIDQSKTTEITFTDCTFEE